MLLRNAFALFKAFKALKRLNNRICRNESVQIQNGLIKVICKPYASSVIYAVTVFLDVLLHFPWRPVATAVDVADLGVIHNYHHFHKRTNRTLFLTPSPLESVQI